MGTGSSSLKTLAQTIQRANSNVEPVARLQDETGIRLRSITGGGMQKQSGVKQKNGEEKTGKKMKTQKKAEVKKMMMVVMMMMMMTMRKKKNNTEKKKKKNSETGKELQMCMTCDSMQPPGSTY